MVATRSQINAQAEANGRAKAKPKGKIREKAKGKAKAKILPKRSNISDCSSSDEPLLSEVRSGPRELCDEAILKIMDALKTSSAIGDIVGRETEARKLKDILNNKKTKKGDFVYIAGQPGTGKSATVDMVISQLLKDDDDAENMIVDKINAVQLSTPEKFYQRLYSKLPIAKKTSRIPRWERAQSQITQYIREKKTNKPKTIIIVDEVDFLLCGKRFAVGMRVDNNLQERRRNEKDQRIIMSLLNWCDEANGKFYCIAISNTIGLPERLMPKARSRMSHTINFAQYTKQTLIDILVHRLTDNDVLDYFPKPAIEFVAAKASAVEGDARSAFSLFRRSVQIAYNSGSKAVSMQHINEAEKLLYDGFNKTFQEEKLINKALLVSIITLLIKDYNGDGISVAKVIKEFVGKVKAGHLGDVFRDTVIYEYNPEYLIAGIGHLQSIGYIVLEADVPDFHSTDHREFDRTGITTFICMEPTMLKRLANAIIHDNKIKEDPNLIDLVDHDLLSTYITT